jgi:hypothetical protein
VEFCESKAEKAQTQSQIQQQQKKETVPDVSMEYDMNADLPF